MHQRGIGILVHVCQSTYSKGLHLEAMNEGAGARTCETKCCRSIRHRSNCRRTFRDSHRMHPKSIGWSTQRIDFGHDPWIQAATLESQAEVKQRVRP